MPEYTGAPITQPGLYPGIPEDVYHRDPVAHEWGSLSVTAAALLVPPRPAAKFDHARRNGRLPSAAMQLGTVTHGLVLGTGQEIAVLDFDDRRTKAYKTAEEAALGLDMLPVLRKEYDEAEAIADSILAHPTAGALLEAAVDREVSGFWVDGEFGIWQRMRMDALALAAYAMPTIVDLKSSRDASPEGFAKSLADYGYHRQDVHYRQGLAACLGLGDWRDTDFVFVVVETEPPYLVATYRADDLAVDLAVDQLKAARERFRACSEAGIWPGYSEEIEQLELPYYKRKQMEKDINEWFD